MPKTLASDFCVEFVPLPEGRTLAWTSAMAVLSELLHQAKEQAQAGSGDQELTIVPPREKATALSSFSGPQEMEDQIWNIVYDL